MIIGSNTIFTGHISIRNYYYKGFNQSISTIISISAFFLLAFLLDLKIISNFCYLKSYHGAEIIISTAVPDPFKIIDSNIIISTIISILIVSILVSIGMIITIFIVSIFLSGIMIVQGLK